MYASRPHMPLLERRLHESRGERTTNLKRKEKGRGPVNSPNTSFCIYEGLIY